MGGFSFPILLIASTVMATGNTKMSINSPTQVDVNQIVPVTIDIQDLPVNGVIGVSASIVYPSNLLDLTVSDVRGEITELTYSFKEIKELNPGKSQVTIIATYLKPGKKGYLPSNLDQTPFATLNFKPKVRGIAKLNFDANTSEIRAKENNEQVLTDDFLTTTINIGKPSWWQIILSRISSLLQLY